MEITQVEIDNMVNVAMEKYFLRMPEIIGNLMSQQANMNKLTKDFFASNPEFTQHKEIVASAIEFTEGKNLNDKYEDILDKAVPEIRKRLSAISKLDFTTTKSVNELNKTVDNSFGAL